jgi:hypothetical protein
VAYKYWVQDPDQTGPFSCPSSNTPKFVSRKVQQARVDSISVRLLLHQLCQAGDAEKR